MTGVIYPLVVTGVAQGLFGVKANGSEIKANGKVVGSSLLGQQGYSLRYFQPRPANGLGTNGVDTRYGLILSGATNLSADSKVLLKQVDDAEVEVVKDDSVPGYAVKSSDVPADALTSSGSGLDPAISPEYAELQVHRVAARNDLPVAAMEKLVKDHTQGRTLGFIGDPRVNVLELNIALMDLAAVGRPPVGCVGDGHARLPVRRESLEDLRSREVGR